VAQAAVGADLRQALERLGALPAEVALSGSVKSRIFSDGESPVPSQTLSAVERPIPKM
jgi:hypothetical protein